MSNQRPELPRIADAVRGLRHVFVRDLVLLAPIGVWEHEQGPQQRIRLNLDLTVKEAPMGAADRLLDVVCYQQVIDRVQSVVAAEHVKLVETLAERVAATCLTDVRILSARVRVEKLDAVPEAASVGVEIERLNPHPGP